MSRTLLRPPAPRGAYPERKERRDQWLERAYAHTACFAAHWSRSTPWHLRKFVDNVSQHRSAFSHMSSQRLDDEVQDLRRRLHIQGLATDVVARAFALVREVAARTLGQTHYDVQLMGGWVLHHGMVAEMETGEGKTLTATLAASTMALAGVPVHVITVNDYLAERDAAWMRPIYASLGLSVGTVVHGMDHQARRQAYASDVTYCCNKEIAFDYLRDRITLKDNPSRYHLQVERISGGTKRLGRLLLRGLRYAIVDEADSVLVDEARTPLIISTTQKPEEERRAHEYALKLADTLAEGRHYEIDRPGQTVHFTAGGKGRLAELGRAKGGVWARRQLREELVLQALSAQHLYLRDRHYLVSDGKVQIVDEYTGRAMPDRSWEHGLHQAVEAKEGCELTPQNHPVARISYQRFFRRYVRLAGMTGTSREVAGELASVYGLGVVRIPTNRTLHRVGLPDRIFRDADEKWSAIVRRIREVHDTGRPILVGTRSVEASEKLSELLTDVGLPHQVLNARQSEEEAEIIAGAGEGSRITVATNMAGRGTDIQLAEGIADLGGLHVIATERHDARRIDRQLFGRCGRQGDPGTHEAFTSLDDELIQTYTPKLRALGDRENTRWARGLSKHFRPVLFSIAQRAAERKHRQSRQDVLRMEVYLENTLAFAGAAE